MADHAKTLARVTAKYGAAREARDEAIRAAHPALSYRAIAAIVGLSYARVAQIVHGR